MFLSGILTLLAFGLIADAQNVNCLTKPGQWSECDPCTKTKSRYLKVVQWPQSDRTPCPLKSTQVEICATNRSCPVFEAPFMASDAPSYLDKCLKLGSMPYLDIISTGMDLTGDQLKAKLFDNHAYDAQVCREVIGSDGQKVYRLPYNLDNINFDVEASGEIEVNSFTSNYHYTSFLKKGIYKSLSIAASFQYGWLHIGAEASFSHSQSFSNLFDILKQHKAVLYQAATEVRLAEFIYKTDGFSLNPNFLTDIARLPSTMNHEAYFQLFKQYGTHYAHSGTLGGTMQYYYAFTEDAMKTLKQNSHTLHKCVKISAKISIIGFYVGVSQENCEDITGKTTSAQGVTSSATKKIVDITGGTAVVAGKLAASLLSSDKPGNLSKFQEWVIGVQKNPVIRKRNLHTICQLFLDTDFPDKQIKFQLCLNATKDYYDPYQVNSCPPCKNGGERLNVAGRCQCACRGSFSGNLCENQWAGDSDERKTVPTNPIKLPLVEGVAKDPPLLEVRQTTWAFGGVLKRQKNKIYHLVSDFDKTTSTNGSVDGSYRVQVFDEYLNLEKTIELDFSTILECTPKNRKVFCKIHDFDVNCNGKLFIYMGIFDVGKNSSFSSIHLMDSHGKSKGGMADSCAEWTQDWSKGGVLSAICDGRLLISCPGVTPALVKIFTSEGDPAHLTQLPGTTSLSSAFVEKDVLWVHTSNNFILSFDLVTWEQTDSIPVPGTTEALSSPRTQITKDFLGNFLQGRAEAGDQAKGSFVRVISYKTKKVLGSIQLTQWTDCFSVSAYGTKMYLSCTAVKPSPQPRGLLAIDYLK